MLEPGDTLNYGAYRIQRELGGGGFGIVYLADDVPLQRSVAIKTLRPEIATQDRAADDFYNEARMNAGLAHPNIIPVHFVGQETVRGRVVHYLVMEFVGGGDLQSVIENETVGMAQRLVWMQQIADGLAHAHQQRVIHRDLKLRNVFVTASRTVKIGDFGLAKAMGTETKTVMKGLGTPAYVSPEQIEGRPTDFRSDVYSLGVLYFHLLTGRLPYDAPDATESRKVLAICYQHVHAPVPSIRTILPTIPPVLDALVQRMMAKAPEHRAQSAVEVHQALSRRPNLCELRRRARGTRGRGSFDRDAPEHALSARQAGARSRQARPDREAACNDVGRSGGAGRTRHAQRPGADARSHVPL